jgi:diguanylate cyclase (GGDEF)-like protein
MTENPPVNLVDLLPAVTGISEKLKPLEVAWRVVNEIAKLLRSDAAVISLWDSSTNQLISQAVYTAGDWELPDNWYQPRDTAAHPFFNRVETGKHGLQAQIEAGKSGQDYQAYLEAAGIQSLLVLPLVAGQGVVSGIIEVVDSLAPRVYAQNEIVLGELLAVHSAIAIQNAIHYQQAQQQFSDLETVRQATLNLTANLNLQDLLDSILQNTIDVMPGMANAHFYLYQDGELQFGSALWRDGSRGTEFATPRRDGLTNQVAETGKMIQIDNMKLHPLFENAHPDWYGSIVSLPLLYGNQVVGVMNVAHPQPLAFKNRHIRILRLLGDQASVSIVNARLHDLVELQARTDPLTGLYNRRALDSRLSDELRRSVRYQRLFSIAMIDFDNFKQVNDKFGHAIGDRVLQRLATCLSDNVRNTDFLARLGGDEFALLMPETGIKMAEGLLQRLCQSVQDLDLELPDARNHALNLSIGISTYPVHGESAGSLLESADQAMYGVKFDSQSRIGIAAAFVKS